MSENVYLINVILHDLLKGIWTDESIKAFNVVEKKLKELDSLHHAYNELNSHNEEIIKENERLKKIFDILVDFLSLDVDLENEKLITILGSIYFFSDKKPIDELKLLKEVLDNE